MQRWSAKKNFESKETNLFPQSSLGWWIFILESKYLIFNFFSELCHRNENFSRFSFHALRYPLLSSRSILLPSCSLYIEKNYAIFLLLSVMSGRQQITIRLVSITQLSIVYRKEYRKELCYFPLIICSVRETTDYYQWNCKVRTYDL